MLDKKSDMGSTSSKQISQGANRKSSKAISRGSSKNTKTRVLAQAEEDVLAALKGFDIVIVVDDSSSMRGRRWKQAGRALAQLAVVASKYDVDGIEIQFLNSRESRENVTDITTVNALFSSVTPYGATPLGRKLKTLLDVYFKELDHNRHTKPVNYIFITDGAPTDGDATENAIVEAAIKLDERNARVTQIGIQFVQIGTDVAAAEYLQSLDDGLGDRNVRDIMDTTTGEGDNLDLVKILIGAVNRRVDNKGSSVLVSKDD